MYSANLKDQLINAAFPLKPLTAWAGGGSDDTHYRINSAGEAMAAYKWRFKAMLAE